MVRTMFLTVAAAGSLLFAALVAPAVAHAPVASNPLQISQSFSA